MKTLYKNDFTTDGWNNTLSEFGLINGEDNPTEKAIKLFPELKEDENYDGDYIDQISFDIDNLELTG